MDVAFLCRHRGVLGNGGMSGGKGIYVAIYGGIRILLLYFIHLQTGIFTISFKRARQQSVLSYSTGVFATFPTLFPRCGVNPLVLPPRYLQSYTQSTRMRGEEWATLLFAWLG